MSDLKCTRCGKEIKGCFYESDIDNKIICIDCSNKEEPAELFKQIKRLEKQIVELKQELQQSEKDLNIVCAEGKDTIREWIEINTELENKVAELEKRHNPINVEWEDAGMTRVCPICKHKSYYCSSSRGNEPYLKQPDEYCCKCGQRFIKE